MGKKGKKAQAGKPKKLTPKDVGTRLNALAKSLEEELKGADLFGPLPPTEDCGICLVPLPRGGTKVTYRGCCSKRICNACVIENIRVIEKTNQAHTCPFCRELEPSEATESIRRLVVRSSNGDGAAYNQLGNAYTDGIYATKDEMRALHYFILGAELGSAAACDNLGAFFQHSEFGLREDKDKAASFYRVGALRGNVLSRHAIGDLEYDEFGNHELAIRHWKIAATAGMQPSLTRLRDIYNANGKKPGKEFIGKDELDSIYRAGHDSQEEIKSEEREKHFEGEDILKC